VTEFFTVIGFVDGKPSSDTDVNSNSHRSVRSYKTQRAAELAIERGTQTPGAAYRILHTYQTSNGWRTDWVD
jgi:hypothetical protein